MGPWLWLCGLTALPGQMGSDLAVPSMELGSFGAGLAISGAGERIALLPQCGLVAWVRVGVGAATSSLCPVGILGSGC